MMTGAGATTLRLLSYLVRANMIFRRLLRDDTIFDAYSDAASADCSGQDKASCLAELLLRAIHDVDFFDAASICHELCCRRLMMARRRRSSMHH